MKTIRMSLISLALLAFLGAASAQTRPTNSDGYLTDSRGSVVKSGTGLCVRTSSYNPATTFHPECDTVVNTPMAEVLPKAAEPTRDPVVVQQNVARVLSQEVLFNFDSAKLTEAGKTQLDQLVRDLNSVNGVNISHVLIDGYTDPISSNSYNIKLSQRRADAVVAYLQSNIGREFMQISAKGETNLKDASCGDRKTAKSIACNAPNRRVEISIHATERK